MKMSFSKTEWKRSAYCAHLMVHLHQTMIFRYDLSFKNFFLSKPERSPVHGVWICRSVKFAPGNVHHTLIHAHTASQKEKSSCPRGAHAQITSTNEQQKNTPAKPWPGINTLIMSTWGSDLWNSSSPSLQGFRYIGGTELRMEVSWFCVMMLNGSTLQTERMGTF